jgi:uncharacterized protein
MSGESNLSELIKGMTPQLNNGKYIFCSVPDTDGIDRKSIICEFREKEGITIVMEKSEADKLHLDYEFTAAWITLMVHSALDAVGLTAKFATELATHNISCNVIAGYYHDHIFVEYNDAQKALKVLEALSKKAQTDL